MRCSCIKSYLPLLTEKVTCKERVNIGLYVCIFCTVMIIITRALCINSLLHRVSVLTENWGGHCCRGDLVGRTNF